MSVPDWSRMIGQQLDDDAWRSRADIWHDEAANRIRSVDDGLAAATLDRTYTPILTQGVGVGINVASARWHKVGRRVNGTVHVTAAAGGTAASLVTLTLPLDAEVGAAVAVGSGYLFDTSLNTVVPLLAYRSGAAQATFIITSVVGTNPYLGTSAAWNLALAAGDILTLELNYSSNVP